MSELRDARLKKALDSAPDAQARPDARTRQAIHAHAHETLAPAAQESWWRRLLGPDHHRLPWSAALATVVMATLVTVLWRDREIPGARPDAVPAQAPVAATSPQPQPAPAAIPAPPAQSRVASAPAIRTRPAKERSAQPPALKDEDARDLAKSAPQRAESARAADTAAAPPPAPAVAAPPAAAGAAARGPAPSAGLESQMRRPAADGAMRLRIVSQGRTVDAPLDDTSRLADLLGRAIAGARDAEPLAASPDMRVELRRRGEPAGVLELAGPQLRWTPPGGEGGTARPDAALLQPLREELERLSR